jgi:putative aldouronate transport system substrate-binding protein
MIDGAAGMGVYAIPVYKEVAQQYVWGLNMDVLGRNGFTADDITDFYSLGPVLEAIKAGEGRDFYPLTGDFVVMSRAARGVDMVDQYNLLAYPVNTSDPSASPNTIVSAYESAEFAQYFEQMKQYNQAGYIDPAATTNTTAMNENWNTKRVNGSWAIEAYPYYPGNEITLTNANGYENAVKPMWPGGGYLSTIPARGAMQAISSASKSKPGAMKVLNLINTDAKFRTMITYGVEGLHWNYDGGLLARTDKGQNYMPWAAGFGAISLLPVEVGQPENLYTEIFAQFNDVKAVPALGFALNSDPVSTQMAVLAPVADQYGAPAMTGAMPSLDPFIEALNANGLQDVLTEANKQLSDFMAAK